MIVQLFIVAFMMGALGSFHCIGMCGPLALSLPLANESILAKFGGALIYNGGRIITYSFFGLLFGLLGKTIALFGFQQWLSIIAGGCILILIIIPKKLMSNSSGIGLISRFFGRLRTAIGRLFLSKNRSSLFAIGLLNGFLPCGLVYLAVAGAIAAGSVGKSVLFMASFGLGTLPMMWGVAFFGNYISISLRQGIRKTYPYLMVMMACLLILRGMGLGIPYISPEINPGKRVIQSCCVKTD